MRLDRFDWEVFNNLGQPAGEITGSADRFGFGALCSQLQAVLERLGHSSIAVTMDIYSHVLPDLQQAAARQFDAGLSRCRIPIGEPDSIGAG